MISHALIDDLLFFGVLGVVLGGRLGYVLFYKPGYYAAHPLEIFAVWQGGMAFHGGLLGVLVAMWWVARKHGIRWLALTDFIAPLIPCGLAAAASATSSTASSGAASDAPLGHGLCAGRARFRAIPRSFTNSRSRDCSCSHSSGSIRPGHARPERFGTFLLGYGVFRFAAEYFREPDSFLGLLAFDMSMGQWLSLPMIAAGAGLLTWAYRRT